MRRSTATAAAALALFLMCTASAAASTLTITYSIDGIAGTNGWYRGSIYGDNVVLHWSVLGATSIITGCLPAITISGPTTGTTETCSARNATTSTTVSTTVKIDDTPPTVTARLSRKPDFNGWYNHPVTVRWSGTDATSGIASCSSVTYQGPEDAAATVNGSCTDKAGNSAGQAVHLAYDGLPKILTLRKTGPIPHVTTNPVFRWRRFRGAGYYNMQLFRGSKRIYAAWPIAHHLGLPKSWKWSKSRFRLTPGRYRWYVWAGLGARRLARYRSVGSASFIVPRP